MNINLLLTISVIMVGLTFIAISDQAESLDITKIIQGTVKETKGTYIKIMEDSDGKEAQIAIDSNTVYDNVQKWADLEVGDKVQIDYKTNHNKNIAITITKIEVES